MPLGLEVRPGKTLNLKPSRRERDIVVQLGFHFELQ